MSIEQEEVILVMPSIKEDTKTEIVWVTKEFAETIKKLGGLKASQAQIKKVYADVRESADIEIENCEQDVERLKNAIDKRNKLLQEAAQYEYETWEEIDRKFRSFKPAIEERMNNASNFAKEVNQKLEQINVWKIEKLIETVENFNRMSESDKDVLYKLLQIHNE